MTPRTRVTRRIPSSHCGFSPITRHPTGLIMLLLSCEPSQTVQGRRSVAQRRPAYPCRSRKFHPRGLARWERIGALSIVMLALLHLFGAFVANRFKSRRRLEIENLYLRHQLNIAMRRVLSEIISGRNGGAVRGRLADTRWEGLNERARQVGLDLMELGRRALS